MSNGSSPSGGRILALLTLFLTLVGPPVALVTFSHSLDLPLWSTIVLVLVYEIVAFFLSILTEVWQTLKAPWIEIIANRIDLAIRHIIRDSRYFGFLLRSKNATRRTKSEREEVSIEQTR